MNSNSSDNRSSKERFLLSVDGGGSKTEVVVAHQVADNPIRELARFTGGSGNLLTSPDACSHVREAIDQVLAKVKHLASPQGALSSRLDATCLCLAGSSRESVRQVWLDWIQDQRIASYVRLTDDCEPILRHCGAKGPAIAAISGTGSIVLGRRSDGTRLRCGGWGPLMSDEGSGYRIALQALRAASFHEDGRSSNPQIFAAVLDHFNAPTFSELIPIVQTASREEIAKLASVIIRLEAEADREAWDILNNAAWQLARMVKHVQNDLDAGDSSSLPLALAGGLFCHSSTLRGQTKQWLERAGVRLEVQLVEDPAWGGILLARDEMDSARKESP